MPGGEAVGFAADAAGRDPPESNDLIFRNSCSLMSPSLRISSKFFSSRWVMERSFVLESRNFDRAKYATIVTIDKINKPNTA